MVYVLLFVLVFHNHPNLNGLGSLRSSTRTKTWKKIDGKDKVHIFQCSGSITFWCGARSGSADPCL
jgi:hypothetical protein